MPTGRQTAGIRRTGGCRVKMTSAELYEYLLPTSAALVLKYTIAGGRLEAYSRDWAVFAVTKIPFDQRSGVQA